MSDILNAERLRLRAERAEQLSATRRMAAFILLALLMAQTWLVVDTTISLSGAQREAQSAARSAAEFRAAYADAARKFGACKVANAGLAEGIRDQQALLKEAIAMAKRCEARGMVQWRMGGARAGEFFAAETFATEVAP